MDEVSRLWLDIETEVGVDDQGRRVQPILGGRRSRPSLVDLPRPKPPTGRAGSCCAGRPRGSAEQAALVADTYRGKLGGGHYIQR
jgi:hypothetical protein